MELLQLIALALIVLAVIALTALAWTLRPRRQEHPVTIVKIVTSSVESHYPPYRSGATMRQNSDTPATIAGREIDRGGNRL